MPSTIFVTGATGQTGGNVCEQLIQRGDQVQGPGPQSGRSLRAVRYRRSSWSRATFATATTCCARGQGRCRGGDHPLCGVTTGRREPGPRRLQGRQHGRVSAPPTFWMRRKAHGMRRVVALSTATFFNLSTGVDFEEAPVLDNPPKDPYTVTKLAAFSEAHRRAAAGDDVLTCHPGAIFGPAPVVERALHRTSFNRVLLAGMRGKIKRYLAFPVTWVAGKDVARGSIAALDRGVAGERYLLVGQPHESFSTAGGINRACEIAGIDHHVEALDYRTDPEALTAEFGPTLMAIAKAAAKSERKLRSNDNLTARRLGYEPALLRRRAAAADLDGCVDSAWLDPVARLNSGLKRRSCHRVDRRTARIWFSSRRSGRSDTRGGSAACAEDGRTQVVIV